MEEPQSTEEVFDQITYRADVAEIHALVREYRCRLKIGDDFYEPHLNVKIYLTNVNAAQPYRMDVSHFVRTPIQASAYVHTRTDYASEFLALDIALSSATAYFKSAIRAGHEPEDSWLIVNEDF